MDDRKEAGNVDDAAEERHNKIETEFKRFKKLRRIQEFKEQREKEEAMIGQTPVVPWVNPEDIRHSANMGSIKEQFEQGKAFASDETPKKQEELDIKVAKKARKKFKDIDAEGAAPAIPKPAGAGAGTESKWTKEPQNVPEAINKRESVESDEDEDEEFEVQNILSKFKTIEQREGKEEQSRAPKPVRQITPPPENYRAEFESQAKERDPNVVVSGVEDEGAKVVRTDAKNLKARFEAGPMEDHTTETEEEKKKRLAEEFRLYKELKASQPVEEPEPTEEHAEKEPINITPEHATKMKQKWEKINKKEAKKAQKAAAHQKTHGKPSSPIAKTPNPIYCFVCDEKVYLAEKVECDGRFFHKMCFKCKECRINLRMGTYGAGPDAIYCTTHYKELYNNMTRPLYCGRSRETTPVA